MASGAVWARSGVAFSARAGQADGAFGGGCRNKTLGGVNTKSFKARTTMVYACKMITSQF